MLRHPLKNQLLKRFRLKIQKSIKVSLFLFLLSFSLLASASWLPFTDVNKSDNFYSNLEYLYNMWIIKDNLSHKFNPNWLIRRDEFVGIVVWVWCKDCISPSISDILKYTSLPFVDVEKSNPYFYCISSGKED